MNWNDFKSESKYKGGELFYSNGLFSTQFIYDTGDWFYAPVPTCPSPSVYLHRVIRRDLLHWISFHCERGHRYNTTTPFFQNGKE